MYLPKNATLIYNFFRKICSKSNWQIRVLNFKNLAHDCVCKLVLPQSPPKPNNNFTCHKWGCERIKAILAEADLIRNCNIDNTGRHPRFRVPAQLTGGKTSDPEGLQAFFRIESCAKGCLRTQRPPLRLRVGCGFSSSHPKLRVGTNSCLAGEERSLGWAWSKAEDSKSLTQQGDVNACWVLRWSANKELEGYQEERASFLHIHSEPSSCKTVINTKTRGALPESSEAFSPVEQAGPGRAGSLVTLVVSRALHLQVIN